MGRPFRIEEYVEHFDHHSPEWGAHLYDIFAYLRENRPVAHTDAHGGYWVITRYDDLMRVARDDETFTSTRGIVIPDVVKDQSEHPKHIPINLDPPQSKAFRRLLDPLVSPKRLADLETYVDELADKLVDDFIEGGEADLVGELAQPLTGMVTLRLAGLPEEDFSQYQEHGPRRRDAARRTPEEEREIAYGLNQWRRNAIDEQIALQKSEPREGGAISYLLNTELDGRKLEDWEIRSIIDLFLNGGLDTTQALLGSSWVYLGTHRDQRDLLIGDPGLIPDALEEMLRYFSPQQAVSRTATRDVEVAGARIRKGDRVLMCWGSGNRDLEAFEAPDRVDLQRAHNRHMTFGVGSHRCMGSHLARMESRICMEKVLQRLPDYDLDVDDCIRYRDVGVVFGYLSVPVRFTPGARVF